MMKKQPRERMRPAVIAAVALVLLAAGGWLGDRTLKSKGHPGLRTFLGQWARNYPASFAIEPELLSITVGEHDLERLERTVEEARARGVILPDGNEYVDAEIGSGADRFKAKLRIKGKLTDHVQGSKWSFRIVAKKDGGWHGMRRFSLQHPGTRNYLCDWFYHRLMLNEGIIALRYGFLRVTFNEEDLGIYAYEEHFGPELLEHNGRLAGPLFRFDPALFWQHRLNEMNKLRFDEPYAAYQAAAVDAFGSSELVSDDKLRGQFEEAVALLDGFRRGELTASQVFDADRIARRHAILDLIGGHHSMDWSDVKFYYDPAAKRIEPVSYESFSAFPLKTLAGSNRWMGKHESGQDLHDQYFNDEQVFRAYVKHLERVSRKSWLDSTFTAMKPALDSASATLYREFPYKELDRGVYYRNQKVIRKLLNGPKPFHAYLGDLAKDTVRITIVPVDGLPMEVHALVLPDGSRIRPVADAIIPCRRPGKVGEPVDLLFAVNAKVSRDELKLVCSVLGSSAQRVVDVFPHAFSVSADQDRLLRARTPNADEFDFLVVDDAAKTITIKPGAWKLDRTMVLPAGYRCVAASPLKLDIVDGAELISYAPLEWNGTPDMPIIVHSTDSSSHGVHVIDAEGRSQLRHAIFADLTRYKYDQERSGDVSFHRSNVMFEGCSFSGAGATLLDVSVCAVDLDQCRFDHGSDAFEAHFAQVTMNDVSFELMSDDAISIEGGSAWMEKVFIGGSGGEGTGMKGTKSALMRATDVHIDRMGKGIEGREGAHIVMSRMDAQDVPVIAVAQKAEMRYGPVMIELKGLKVDATDASYEVGEGSTITVEGKRAGSNKAKEGT